MNNPIIDKLAKLLRHQEGARAIGSLAEAEAFAGRIQELLTKHKLEMSDIQLVEQEAKEPVDSELFMPERDLPVKYERKRVEWQEDLASAIARANDCRTLISNHSNAAFFVGRKSDREVCVTLHRYFLGLIIEMSEKTANEARDVEREKLRVRRPWYTGADLRWHMRDFKVSYCEGMSSAIQHRLYERRRALEAELKKKSAESTALIHLRNTAEAISEFLDNKFRDRKPSRAKENIQETGHVSHAYSAGRQAGESVALTSGALKE